MRKIVFLLCYAFSEVFVEGSEIYKDEDIKLFLNNFDLSKEQDLNAIENSLFKRRLFKKIEVKYENSNYYFYLKDGFIVHDLKIKYQNGTTASSEFNNLSSIKKGSVIDRKDIELDISLMRDILSSQGLHDIRVTSSFKKEKYNNKIFLTYTICIPPSASSLGYTFFGNTFFSQSKLENVMPSNTYIPIDPSKNLSVSGVQSHIDAIKKLYHSYGFFDAVVDLQSVVLSEGENYYNYVFLINEGVRYTNSFILENNTLIVDKELNTITKLNDNSKNKYLNVKLIEYINTVIANTKNKYSDYNIELSFTPNSKTNIVDVKVIINYNKLHNIKDIKINNNKISDAKIKKELKIYPGFNYTNHYINKRMNDYFLHHNHLTDFHNISFKSLDYNIEEGNVLSVDLVSRGAIKVGGHASNLNLLTKNQFAENIFRYFIIDISVDLGHSLLIPRFPGIADAFHFSLNLSLEQNTFNIHFPVFYQYFYLKIGNKAVRFYNILDKANLFFTSSNLSGVINLSEIFSFSSFIKYIYIDVSIDLRGVLTPYSDDTDKNLIEQMQEWFVNITHYHFPSFEGIKNKIIFLSLPFLIQFKSIINKYDLQFKNKNTKLFIVGNEFAVVIDLILQAKFHITENIFMNFISKPVFYSQDKKNFLYKRPLSNISKLRIGQRIFSDNDNIYDENSDFYHNIKNSNLTSLNPNPTITLLEDSEQLQSGRYIPKASLDTTWLCHYILPFDFTKLVNLNFFGGINVTPVLYESDKNQSFIYCSFVFGLQFRIPVINFDVSLYLLIYNLREDSLSSINDSWPSKQMRLNFPGSH